MSSFSTYVAYGAPFAMALFVSLAVFVVGAPRPYVGARIRGGPTDGSVRVAWHLDVVERFLEIEEARADMDVVVEATAADGRRAHWRGKLDHAGSAEAILDFGGTRGPGAIAVSVTTPGRRRPLARGTVVLGRGDWLRGVERYGGWIEAAQHGELAIRVAPERGVLAVPFRDAVWIDVRDAAGPVRGAELSFVPEAVDLHPRGPIRTDARGRARLELTVLGHSAVLQVAARLANGASGKVEVALPVVPGALDARLDGKRLRVVSPIERDAAWVSVVDASDRLAGGRVRLEPDGRGGAVGWFALDADSLPPGRVWAVVSSEPDMESMALVGWPLRVPQRGEPATANAVRDRMLLDGLPGAHRAEERRRSRARWIAALFCVGTALLVALILFRRVRASQLEIERHFRAASIEDGDDERLRPARGHGASALGIALACVLLGFAAVALIAIYKIG